MTSEFDKSEERARALEAAHRAIVEFLHDTQLTKRRFEARGIQLCAIASGSDDIAVREIIDCVADLSDRIANLISDQLADLAAKLRPGSIIEGEYREVDPECGVGGLSPKDKEASS